MNMKNYFYSALAMIVLAGCAGSEIEEVVDNGQPVAIALKAGVQTTSVVSRAPITGSAAFKPTIMGWNVADEPGEVAPAWATTTNEDIAGDASNVGITLSTPQYYPADGSKTYMKAFYAEGATINATNTWKYDFTNTDGQKDVLMADVISGDKNAPAIGFTFTHPLMQLKFKLVAGAGFPAGVKVTSMTINGAELPIGVDMSNNSVTYATAAALAVPGAADVSIPAETAGSPVMVKPFEGKTFKMDIVAGGKTYSGVTVTLDDVIGAGVAYTVTLTFKEKISATASVTDWTTGTGSGEVE